MFRSQDMKLNQLIFAKESIWDTFNFLASTQEIMFAKNNDFKQGPLSNTQNFSLQKTKHFDDLIITIEKLKKIMQNFGYEITPYKQQTSIYYRQLDQHMIRKNIRGDLFHLSFEEKLRKDYEKIMQLVNNQEKFQYQRNSILNKINGLKNLEKLMSNDIKNQLGEINMSNSIANIFGSIRSKDELKIRKLLFRIVRENIIIKTQSIKSEKDTLTDKYYQNSDKINEPQTLILILIPNMRNQNLLKQIEYILRLYEFESLKEFLEENFTQEELIEELDINTKILEQLKITLNQQLQVYCKQYIIPGQSYINVLELIFQREKKYAAQMMEIEERDGFYQTKIWVPSVKIEKFEQEIENIRIDDVNFIKPQLIPYLNDEILIFQEKYKVPSKFNNNNFIYPFQQLVNTYGIPIYKEANPALFTTVTFPFQFGLMFGDIGHGILLLLFSLTLFSTFQHVEVLNKIKYMFLMMSIFSIFCGFIYNDFFGNALLIFDSCYDNFSYIRKYSDCVYPIGIDWIWHQSYNETGFINSFKMKVSIIIGVIHMLLGIFLKILNSFYFKKKIDFFFEAFPQIIFMLVTFGYMSICIIIKWVQNWTNRESVSIIALFINFNSVDIPLYSTQDIQNKIHLSIIIIVILCIFFMLIPKPIILYYKNKKQKKDENEDLFQQNENNFGELFIHQMIEVIEFILGSVSNTASYLRLWALSLAHNQLARVFQNMIYGWTIQNSSNFYVSTIVIILGFIFWFFVTLAVIMLMDLMECFLHALRLHWVEFQNKFFKGNGILFKPFTEQTIEDDQIN